MVTQSVMKIQARQTMPKATPRACRPTRHRAATKVWTARSWRKCISGSQTEIHCYKGETHEGDQCDSNFTNLLDDALCRAIVPCRDDPVVSPPDIEDTTHGLEKIEHEEGELSREFNEPSEWQWKTVRQTM
jgi:hypothetical protein